MKKKQMGAVLAGALLVSQLAMPAAAQSWAAPGQAVPTSAVRLIPQNAVEHTKYMEGSGGWFNPEQSVTRAELAQMLARVVAGTPVSSPFLNDVPAGIWYAPAVQKAAGLGLLTSSEGAFRPDAPATRAECAYALSLVIPYDVTVTQGFPDVAPDHWAWYAISRTAAYGLFHGDAEGLFHPDDPLKRCEAVAVFNRLLGRSPDLQTLAWRADLRTFPDVPPSHWAYAEIMEATVTHQYAAAEGGETWLSLPAVEPVVPETPGAEAAGLPNGPQRIDGHLYWVVDGTFARSCSMDGLQFDENGWYTTGDAELDGMLNELVDRLTNESMTRDQKLRALYNYIRDNFTYLKRPLISKGQTGWHAQYAKYFLTNGKGNCYNFSATYCLLCQELGLPAYTVVGSVLNSPHGWVEIVLDGEVYMFDTQLEWRYLHQYKKTGYDLFKMSPRKTPFKYTWY